MADPLERYSPAGGSQVESFARLERDRALLAAIVAGSEDAIISMTLDGHVLTWNEAAQELFGYTAAEMIGRSILMILPRELWHEETEILGRLGSGETVAHYETVRVAKDGRKVNVSLTISPMLDEHGSVIGASKIARDITEHKRTLESLQHSEERLRALVESQSEMICRFDRSGKILFANGAYARAYGTTPDALVGSNFWRYIPDVERETVQALLDRLNPEHPEVTIENQLDTAYGRRWFLWKNCALIFDKDGRCIEAQSVGVDITERRRAEDALRESEARFRTLANNIDQFVWRCEKLGVVTWFNERWYDYTGGSPSDMLGTGWQSTHHEEHRARVLAGFRRCAVTGEPWEDTFPIRGGDGSYRWFLSRAKPLRDSGGRIVHWFGTCTDVSKPRELEEALRLADKRKDEFLATLAHELRNPLAPISNSLEILRYADQDPDLRREARAVIDRQLSHMVRLVDDLLDVSRITRDKLELKPRPIELAAVVEEALETVRPQLVARGQGIEVALPGTPVQLYADPIRLAQVLGNVLSNASKYTQAGGRIRLSAERHVNVAIVTISDNGRGIPPDKLESIFEMFTQVERPVAAQEGGLGIGLTLVKRLVELHGGSIRAYSSGLGCGSEFSIHLPLGSAASVGTESAVSSPAGRPKRILVVDDNVDSADSLATLLSLDGHQTHVAYDGAAAIEAADCFSPDVLLLDLGLPKIDGIEACRRIRRQPWGRSMRIVALTGWGQEEDRRRSSEAGFDGHLVKPVGRDAILKLLAGMDCAS